jgi:hypothetical protein
MRKGFSRLLPKAGITPAFSLLSHSGANTVTLPFLQSVNPYCALQQRSNIFLIVFDGGNMSILQYDATKLWSNVIETNEQWHGAPVPLEELPAGLIEDEI